MAYTQSLKEFIFSLLEKDKSKRAFIIDLFEKFPQRIFKMNEVDLANFEAYGAFKEGMEHKRRIDGNKVRIHE